MAPVPESVSRSMSTSSPCKPNRLYPTRCRAASRCSGVVCWIACVEWMRKGSMMVRKDMAVMLPPWFEERPQQGATLLLLHPSDHLYPMIQAGVPQDVPETPRHPRLRVVRSEDDTPDFGEDDRARALRARLERHVQRAVAESISLQQGERSLHGQELGVRRRIAPADGLVVGPHDHRAVPKHGGAHRNLSSGRRATRFFQRNLHAGRVGGGKGAGPLPASRFLPPGITHAPARPPPRQESARTSDGCRPSPGLPVPCRLPCTALPVRPWRAGSAAGAGWPASTAAPRRRGRSPTPRSDASRRASPRGGACARPRVVPPA